MRRKLFIGAIIIFLAVAILGYLFLWPSSDVTQPSGTPAPKSSDVTKKQPALATTAEQPGSYKDYTEAAFTSTTGTRLLFFHAPWCSQCRALDESIKSAELASDLTIFKVDYDSQLSLKQKYGVTLQTTIVSVAAGGEAIKKIVAYNEPSYATLERQFDL